MIWQSVPLMVSIDLVIIGMAVALSAYVIKVRGFGFAGSLAAGRWLVLGGIFVTGVFYATDLFIMLGLSYFAGSEKMMSVMRLLHLEVRWPVSALSMGMICGGIFLLLNQRKILVSRMRESEDLLASVRHNAVQSEVRYRSILEQTPYSIYCYEFDPPFDVSRGAQALIGACHEATLVEANHAFARELRRRDPRAARGFRYGDMEAARDELSHARLMQDFVAGGYRLVEYELNYRDSAGENCALQLNWDGVVRKGLLKRIWGAEQNIIDIKNTQAELAGRKLFEKLVAEVSTRLIVAPEDRLGEEIQKCLKMVCDYAAADRAVLLWMKTDTRHIELLAYWNPLHSPQPVKLSEESFPWSSAELFAGRVVVIDDIERMPADSRRDYDAYSDLGIRSTIAVPLSIGGSVFGALSIGNISREHHWSDQLVSELDVLGSLFGNTIWRIRSKQKLDDALADLQQARDHLEAENIYLQDELRSTHGFDGLVGESYSFKKSLRQVEQVAATKTAVLIQGETGTGKELIARAIHAHSDRNKRPLVKVNCAALPSNLIESELFGHEKGAFTGADARKRGRFDLAHRGTLFLDEIGDFPLELQGKLLRVLQEGEFERVGGIETIKVDVRLIAATNRDLRQAVDRGEFRADLYYRISTFPIELPALRDRDGDIPLLARHFVRKYAQHLGKEVSGISTYMLQQMQSYSWPGNVRELEAVIQRAIIYAVGPVIDLREPLIAGVDELEAASGIALPIPPVDLREVEREHIQLVLEQTRWVIAGVSGAAVQLGLPPSTLRSKMKKLGIERP